MVIMEVVLDVYGVMFGMLCWRWWWGWVNGGWGCLDGVSGV